MYKFHFCRCDYQKTSYRWMVLFSSQFHETVLYFLGVKVTGTLNSKSPHNHSYKQRNHDHARVLSSHLAFFTFIQSRTPKWGVTPSTLRLGLSTSVKTTSSDMSTGQSDLIHPSRSCSSQIIPSCDKFAIKAGHHNPSLGSTDRA